ncbi:MAG: peptidoglycan DD-metalloendopeptidase family protein [bacterium]
MLLPLSTSVWAQTGADGHKLSEAEIEQIEAAKKQEQADLAAQKHATGAQLSAARKERKSVLGDLTRIDSDLLQTRSRLGSLQKQLDQQQEELNRTTAQHDRNQAEYELAQARLSARLRNWYMSERAPMATFIMTANGLKELTYQLRYAEAALTNDRKTMAFIRDQRQALEDESLDVQTEMGRTNALAGQVDTERAKFQGLRNEKQGALDDVNRDVRKLERAYNELEQSSQEIEWFLASLHDGGSPTFGGTFKWPLSSRNISSGFGYRRHPILKKRKMHTGLDMPSPAGTPIHAAAAGTVVFSGWKNGYGKCAIINHGKGFATLYGHMSSIKVSVGQAIAQGGIVGAVGSTGMSTGNHLHFEIRIDGKPVNPRPYL